MVQGSQTYAAEIWLHLVEPRAADQTFTAFMQHFLHLRVKTSRLNIYVLTGQLPFSVWAQRHAVAFLLYAVAAPCDTLLHQCLVELMDLHGAGHPNWTTEVIKWIRRWDSRFGLRLHSAEHGRRAVCMIWTSWDESAPQRT